MKQTTKDNVNAVGWALFVVSSYMLTIVVAIGWVDLTLHFFLAGEVAEGIMTLFGLPLCMLGLGAILVNTELKCGRREE